MILPIAMLQMYEVNTVTCISAQALACRVCHSTSIEVNASLLRMHAPQNACNSAETQSSDLKVVAVGIPNCWLAPYSHSNLCTDGQVAESDFDACKVHICPADWGYLKHACFTVH